MAKSLEDFVTTIPDFPQPGVLFRDITTIIQSPEGFKMAVDMLVEKPKPEEAPSNLAIASRYVMTPAIFGYLHSGKPGKGGEIQLTDAMRALCAVQPMFGLEFRGRRHDIGSKLDFVKATLEFALARPEFHDALAEWLKDLRT